jgi:hypothetical protein
VANRDGWILAGDQLDMIERKFSLPDVGTVTRTVLRDDGGVFLVTEHGLVLVDRDTVGGVETALNAVAVATDGTYAVNKLVLRRRVDAKSVDTEVLLLDPAPRHASLRRTAR